MIQEEKDLLLKDLCARLPYGVKVRTSVGGEIRNDKKQLNFAQLLLFESGYEDIKPYLFPLSSMTEEQKKEFISVAGYEASEEDCGRHKETYYYDMVGHEHNFYPNSEAIDWLNAHHFDYRDLIEKGLALDATGLNIY